MALAQSSWWVQAPTMTKGSGVANNTAHRGRPDELDGRQLALGRVLPARQGFDASQVAAS